MSVIAYPAGLQLVTQSWGQDRFDKTFSSGDTGASQTAVLGPPRWTCGFAASPALPAALAATWRALVLNMEGRINKLAVYDIANPRPRGTVQGFPTAFASAARGADSITIAAGSAMAGRTLLVGDWIGVNQAAEDVSRQLLMVTQDAVFNASGVATVSIRPRLRAPVLNSSLIVLERPTCLMRATIDNSRWQNSAGRLQGGFSLDLRESWE